MHLETSPQTSQLWCKVQKLIIFIMETNEIY